MASSQLTCPDCRSVLRPAKPVPDGKKVKCPKCGNLFTTPGLLDDEKRPRKKQPAKKKAQVVVKKTSSPPPAAKPPADDDDDGIYNYIPEEEKAEEDKPQIEYAPDMSIKDLRGPAQAAVVAPSNYLLLVAGLGCLCDLFIICVCFWPMVFSESVVNWQAVLDRHYKDEITRIKSIRDYKDLSDEEKKAVGQSVADWQIAVERYYKEEITRVNSVKEFKDLKEKDLDIVHEAEHIEYIHRFIGLGLYIFLFIYNAVTIIGAVKMQNLESRGWGIASSIMTMLPMGASGLSGLFGGVFYVTIGAWFLDEMNIFYSIGIAVLPYLLAIFIGVWSLRTLMSEEVVAGFEYVAE